MLTLRNGQEAKKYNAVAVRTADIIMYVPDGQVHWPVFIVSGAY